VNRVTDQVMIDALQQKWLVEEALTHRPTIQIGCGMKWIPGIVNTDPNPERAMWADVACFGDDLPFDDGAFNCVVSSHVINVFPDPIAAFREWARVLRPGGWCCHVIPDWRYAPNRKSSRYRFEKQHHCWRGPVVFQAEVMDKLSDVFRVVELECFEVFKWSFKLRAVRL